MSDDQQSAESEDVLPVRRRVLKWFGGLGIVAFIGGLLAPIADLDIAAKGEGDIELPGQQLVLAEKYTPDGGSDSSSVGETVTADMVGEAPEYVLTYPANLEGENDYLIILHRLEADRLAEPTNLDWADQGFVAYSAICTHLGCTVGWEESDSKPSNVSPEKQKGPSDLCPCHLSSFNPYEGAEVMGGPAPRPVPQIGITVTDSGAIQLTSKFEGPIGGG